ncbi:Natural cytotoxicity triggering receptor 1 [Pteropus alecto]|uniref:Natural cytotoxicity triggering receptor 1 n=1 Tax=Pteropus alecto TaxID=9402 RepID=L5KFB2_PTEAL|nr:Natural cytotoxicity triggering receptor 1 [Pteropus alecto]
MSSMVMAAASEAFEDVTYAQLDIFTLIQKTIPPPSQETRKDTDPTRTSEGTGVAPIAASDLSQPRNLTWATRTFWDPPRVTDFAVKGLYLSQRVSSQIQTLSKPTIWAKPNFMIPNGMPVIIWCQGMHKATEYRLYFEGQLSALERPNPPGMMNKVKFPTRTMTSNMAGQYTCSYRSGELWSKPSDPLDLVITGMYDKPTLSVHPGSEVISGEKVTFYCRLETATSTFFLLKEGRSSHPQRRYGNMQAEFSMNPVTAVHGGTYRCFGSYNNHVWSLPSEPVTLLVTGGTGNTSLTPTEQPSSSGE